MTPRESGLAEVDGGKLAWESAGEGPDVVFLHPGLWDSRVWDQQFGVFSKTYRVLRHDFRGYGRSSRLEPRRPYSHVDDLEGLMTLQVSIGLRSWESMGGRWRSFRSSIPRESRHSY
jgi:pimeloyl-ACP methyl ester carboxylesterase